MSDFIDRFVKASEGIESPETFRRWSAVACVSGALERKVWSITWGTVYPNLFIVLTANPGVGKTLPIVLVQRFWSAVTSEKLNVAPTTVTKAALIDHYVEYGLRMPAGNGPASANINMFSSCLVAAREFGHLVTEFDLPFLNTLNDFFDCVDVPYVERTRGKGEIRLENTHMVMLAGAQPSWLSSVFPEQAFSMGTASRIIFVYSNETALAPLWNDLEDDTTAKLTAKLPIERRALNALIGDLNRIASMQGCFLWERTAKALMIEWVDEGQPPKPQHHRLLHYRTRRPLFLLKLAMIFSASESSKLIINQSHVMRAMKLLFEAEAQMPEIFKEMSVATGSSVVINDLMNWMFQLYSKKQRPITEMRLWEFLKSRLPASQIKPNLEALVQSGMITEVPNPNKLVYGAHAGRFYIPRKAEEEAEED